MRVPLSWLAEFVPLPDDPEDLAVTLSDLGLAVESLDRVGEGLGGVVVARVAATRPHPDADRIQVVDVDTGSGDLTQVCCGAFNFAPGDLVPLATVGAELPGGVRIGRRKLRGVVSNGMLCSAVELGLGTDAAGILVLGDGLELGVPVTEALGVAPDVVFDLEINPNRPDALSVLGIARDLAARLGRPLDVPVWACEEAGRVPVDELASVVIEAPESCGRFTVRVFEHVSPPPTPAWMQRRLTLAGMRPISPIVDISNYVMLELGQPNHAYDYDRVAGGGLRIRHARSGEHLVTLDGVERTLEPVDLLICDAEDTPIGLGGVMGGATTEIHDATTRLLLETAWFAPLAVARSAKHQGLRTEASVRFERGCDPEGIDRAVARFATLLGHPSVPGVVDARGDLPAPRRLLVDVERVNSLLGTELSAPGIAGHLGSIGFDVAPTGPLDRSLDVAVPSWRPDVTLGADIAEEVARLHGYGRIVRTVPRSPRPGGLSPHQHRRRLLREVLVGLGCSEAMPTPLVAPATLERAGFDPAEAVALANPLVAEESVLRTSLLPGLVGAVATNQAHRNTGVRLFEIQRVFRRAEPDAASPVPVEAERLGVVLAGGDAPEAVRTLWAVLDGLGLAGRARLVGAEHPGLHPTRAATVLVDGTEVGEVGEVDPGVLEAVGVDGRVGWIGADVVTLLERLDEERPYRPVSRFPSSDIDLAFEVPEAVPAGDVHGQLADAGGAELVGLRLFDVYRGPGLPDGTRSLAFALRFQAPDHTLDELELAGLRQRCIDAVVDAGWGVRLRGEA